MTKDKNELTKNKSKPTEKELTPRNKRNGSIELMRFIFASGIVFFHVCGDVWDRDNILFHAGSYEVTFFRSGFVGVEFFFLVSGYLMASSVFRRNQSGLREETLGEETARFIWRKIKTIWPYYLPLCLIMVGAFRIVKGEEYTFLFFLNQLPSLLFLQETGLCEGSFIGASWYISAMLIAMCLLYPLCRKHYSVFTMVGAVCGLLITGALVSQTGNLGGGPEHILFVKKSVIRALAELTMGAGCFEICRRLKEIRFSVPMQLVFTVTAAVCYGLVLCFECSNLDRRYTGLVLLFICVAVIICFSEIGFLMTHGVFQHRLFWFLGSISLPLYLSQNVYRFLIPHFFGDLQVRYQVLLIYACILVTAILFDLVVKTIQKRIASAKAGAAR